MNAIELRKKPEERTTNEQSHEFMMMNIIQKNHEATTMHYYHSQHFQTHFLLNPEHFRIFQQQTNFQLGNIRLEQPQQIEKSSQILPT